jgi:hypothetical protein
LPETQILDGATGFWAVTMISSMTASPALNDGDERQ